MKNINNFPFLSKNKNFCTVTKLKKHLMNKKKLRNRGFCMERSIHKLQLIYMLCSHASSKVGRNMCIFFFMRSRGLVFVIILYSPGKIVREVLSSSLVLVSIPHLYFLFSLVPLIHFSFLRQALPRAFSESNADLAFFWNTYGCSFRVFHGSRGNGGHLRENAFLLGH